MQKKALAVFLFLTFIISWSLWVPLWVWQRDNPDLLSQSSFLLILMQTLGAAAPSISAVIVIKFFYGKIALNRVFQKYLDWRQPPVYIFLAVTLLPFINFLSLLLFYILEGVNVLDFEKAPITSIVVESGWLALLVTLPIVFITNLLSSPLLEELGWRGFLLPFLQDRYNALLSSLFVGITWGLWHLPLWILYNENLVSTLLLITGHSILYTWIFNSTRGSMLITLFFHSSANLALNLLNVPAYLNLSEFANLEYFQVALTWLIALTVIIFFGYKNLSRTPKYVFPGNIGKE
jgi:hypothetical protein